MVSFLESQTKEMKIGSQSAWTLEFYKTRHDGTLKSDPELKFTDDDYYATIKATLPSNLEGGTYTFVVEGITDDHYRKIAQIPDLHNPSAIKLYLYWKDTNASVGGYLANVAGLGSLTGKLSSADLDKARVAVLSITRVTRRAGARRYEAVIEAQERAFVRLTGIRVDAEEDGSNVTFNTWSEALDQIGTDTGITVHKYGFGADGSAPAATGPNPGDETTSFDHDHTYADMLKELAKQMEQRINKRGRGMILVRDGEIHFGPRDIPLHEDDPTPLRTNNGLIESHSTGTQPGDPAGTGITSLDVPEPDDSKPRRLFELTLKGRPDLKPGDLVKFEPAPEDQPPAQTSTLAAVGQALAGAFAGPLLPTLGGDEFQNPVRLYVTSVTHSLGRATGFSTVVSGLEMPAGRDEWDSESSSASAPATQPSSPTGDPGAHAAAEVHRIAQSAAGNRRTAEVGEVRTVNTQGTSEPPRETETVYRGLVQPDGGANGARRLAIQRDHPTPVTGVPYATPWAWGKCGLILPRYPGTRVLLVHRNGQANDPVDIGSLWESGHGPDSHPGDWWLTLPVDVPQSQRSTVADGATPTEHTGIVTNDLIDGDGNRVIEVGQFTLRVGKSNLKTAGTRPAAADQDTVTITNPSKSSSIVMKADGSIQITAPNMTFDAGSSGTITMKADTVDVQVTTAMNVH